VEIGNRAPVDERQTLVVTQEGLDMPNVTDFAPFEAPVLDERPWAVFSACREADPTLFFASRRVDERAALAVCSTCTVQDECLSFALETRERFGVWGGTSERERKRLLRA
jgi:WhiB family redox-sensing transcriptional regulator